MVIEIAANKFRGTRAATCESSLVAICARSINNTNALCLGECFNPESRVIEKVDTFFNHMGCRFISSVWSGGQPEASFVSTQSIAQTRISNRC